MYELSDFHITYLRQHMDQYGILTYIPVICRKDIIRSLIQDCIQCQFIMSRFLGYIKCHTVCTRIEIHLMQIFMHINIRHDSSAVWIILKVIDYTVHLIKHAFFILVLYAHLISISLSDRTVFIRPTVPDMTVKIIDIIRFLLPDPQKLIRTAFDCCSSKCQCRKFFRQIIPVHNSEFLDRICRCSIFPYRSYFFASGIGTVIDNVTAHIDKYFVCITHFLFLLSFPVLFTDH